MIGTPTNEDVVIVRLMNPIYNSSTRVLSFDVKLLHDNVAGVLAYFNSRRDDKLSQTFGEVSLFIDGGESCYVGPTEQCQGANLEGQNLAGENLQSADLQNADLMNANLTQANLLNANLCGADLNGAIFCQTVLPDGSESDDTCPSSLQSTDGAVTTQWLNQQMLVWGNATVYPINFATLFARLSYTNPYASYNTDPVLDSELSMIKQTSAKAVRIDMDYGAWLTNNTATIQKYDNYVSDIRSNGNILILADAAAGDYRNDPQPWLVFQSAWIQRVQTLATRYHPSYYIVIKEPDWYLVMIQGAASNPPLNASQWASLAQTLASTVKSVSPNTVVGVSVAANLYHQTNLLELDFLTDVVRDVPNINFIGFDMYSTFGFLDTQQFLNTVGSNGKQLWIAEAWSSTGTLAFNSSRSSLDVQWIQALYYFALTIHAGLVMPFFTDCFASYSWTNDTSQILSNYQERIPVFSEFQSIIRSNGQ